MRDSPPTTHRPTRWAPLCRAVRTTVLAIISIRGIFSGTAVHQSYPSTRRIEGGRWQRGNHRENDVVALGAAVALPDLPVLRERLVRPVRPVLPVHPGRLATKDGAAGLARTSRTSSSKSLTSRWLRFRRYWRS